MMRAHIIDAHGKIINTIVIDELWENMVDADLVGGGIGDSYINAVLIPQYVPPTPDV
jgi:hypothetical protein